jgi:hypothetical protein
MVAGWTGGGIGRVADGWAAATRAALFEPVLRLGVTGLSGAGKTVFITALVANLLDRGRMPQLLAAPRIEAAFLQPQPDLTLPRFDFETHLAAMTGPAPVWPQSTRALSELRLSLRVRPEGFWAGLGGPRTLHLDILDYPGEWLLDLALLETDYAGWAEGVLARLPGRPGGAGYAAEAAAADPAAPHDEARAQALAARFTAHLAEAKAAGWADCTPGRFLLPGDLAGSPVLTFAPLPRPAGGAPRGSLWREMARRFDAYRSRVVVPFFRDHFARVERQVVLVDVLGAIAAGPAVFQDLRRTMAAVLRAFRPGVNGLLAQLLGLRRVERILFAATKADHLHHTEHGRLAALAEAMLREARERAAFSGALTAAMAVASLRATVEEEREAGGERLGMVRGRLADGRQVALWPGGLPEDPGALLAPAQAGAADWPGGAWGLMRFAPAAATLRPGEGPPHIRLDRAAEFLIGDRLG